MFFLLRMAFWLSLVLILLPMGSSQQVPPSDVGTTDAISAASATVGDLRQFCTRQPDACTVGSHVATSLGYKAQAGAKMLYDFLTEQLGAEGNRLGGEQRFALRQIGAGKAGTRQIHHRPGLAKYADARRPRAGLARSGPAQRRQACGLANQHSANSSSRPRRPTGSGPLYRGPYRRLRAWDRAAMAGIDEILDNFSVLDDWDDRYRYLIELGRALPPLAKRHTTTPIRSRAAPAKSGSTPPCGPMARAARY